MTTLHEDAFAFEVDEYHSAADAHYDDDRPTLAEVAADEADYQDDVDWAEHQAEKNAGWYDDVREDPWAS